MFNIDEISEFILKHKRTESFAGLCYKLGKIRDSESIHKLTIEATNLFEEEMLSSQTLVAFHQLCGDRLWRLTDGKEDYGKHLGDVSEKKPSQTPNQSNGEPTRA